MEYLTEDDANLMLESFSNSYFRVVLYTDTLSRIVFELCNKNSEKVLFIFGVGCKKFEGFFWGEIESLNISKYYDSIKDETEYYLSDETTKLKLVTNGGIFVSIGKPEDIMGIERNFMGHKFNL